jgi:hypothetical protein
LGGKKWYLDPRRHKEKHNQEESLITGAGEEGVAAEEPITRDGTFADKPSLTWAGEVEK